MSGWLHLIQREKPEQVGINTQQNPWTGPCGTAALHLWGSCTSVAWRCSPAERPAGLKLQL